MTRTITIVRRDVSWWDFPWIAKLYENGQFMTLAIGSTRRGALKDLRRKIEAYDRPEPEIIFSEEVPYDE